MQTTLLSDPNADLDGTQLWSDLSQGAALELASSAERLHIARGEDIPTDIGIVIGGIVGVRRLYSDGRHLYCALFHRGDLFDVRREERKRQGLLLAVTETQVLCLEDAALKASARAHPDLAELMVRQLREQSARLRDHCADLAFKTPVERLASAILEFRRWPEVREEGECDGVGMLIRLPVTRADIASYMGLKPETVSRALKQLARDGIIRKAGPRSLEILNLPSLRMAANGGRPRGSGGSQGLG